MSQIDELQSRMTRALDRISKGVETLSAMEPPAPEPLDDGSAEEIARLSAALEDEQMANAQLEARVKSLHDQIEAQPETPEAPEPDEVPDEVPDETAEEPGTPPLDVAVDPGTGSVTLTLGLWGEPIVISTPPMPRQLVVNKR